MPIKSVIYSTILCLGIFPAALASASETEGGHDLDLGGGHSYSKHTFGLFGGGTSVSGETNFTFGAEYEFRFSQYIGVGAIYEHTPKAHHGDGTSIYMGLVHLHPWKMLRLSAGIGTESVHAFGAHSETVYRLGAAYDFHVGGFGIAPTINIDFIGGHEAIVFGVALTKGF